MNARLLAKLLRRRPQAPRDGLRLLGEGLDAVLVRMRVRGTVAPLSPSPEERLLRYMRARAAFVTTDRELTLLTVRIGIGEGLHIAWSRGVRPRFNSRPHRSRIPTHRSAP